MSDAHLYWGKKFDITQNSWSDFASYGTDFILFLNYPFIKLGFPFWSGFLIYGIIGFLGIVKWIQWIEIVFGNKVLFRGINVLPILYFLPNIHIWTSAIGKDVLVFWGIATIFYAMAINHYKSYSFILGVFLVLLIRPHVALMLVVAIGIVQVLSNRYSIKKRLMIGGGAIVLFSLFSYMVLQLSGIKRIDFDRIKYFNDFSITSFKDSGSYVPMLEYNWFYKLFSFNFRPLFYDSNSVLQHLASVENLFSLLIHLLTLVFVIKNNKNLYFPQWVKISFLFVLISSVLFVQRYANLGIFMRTKIMFQPFLLVALLFLIKQSLFFEKDKVYE